MSTESPRSRAATIDPFEADLLVTSVMAAVRATDQDRRPALVLPRDALGVVGILTVAVAIGGILIMNMPKSGVGPPSSSLASFHEAGLSFDYPSGWTRSSAEVATGPGLSPAFFVGSAQATATCVPLPSSEGALECDGFVASLEPDTVVARIVVDDSSPWVPHYIVGEAESLVIGGLPALKGQSAPILRTGADRTTTWILTSLQDLNRHYIVTVAMRGPDLAGLQAQIDSLLASITFDPPSPAASASSASPGVRPRTRPPVVSAVASGWDVAMGSSVTASGRRSSRPSRSPTRAGRRS
jgi:hypothetical protein